MRSFGECSNRSSDQFGDEQRQPCSREQYQSGDQKEQQDIRPTHGLACGCELLIIALALGDSQHRGIKVCRQRNGHNDQSTSSDITLADCIRQIAPTETTIRAERVNQRSANLLPFCGRIDGCHRSMPTQREGKTALQRRSVFVQRGIRQRKVAELKRSLYASVIGQRLRFCLSIGFRILK